MWNNQVYSTKEVAKILQTTPNTVRLLIKSRRLKGTKVGRGYRVAQAALNEFLKVKQK